LIPEHLIPAKQEVRTYDRRFKFCRDEMSQESKVQGLNIRAPDNHKK
jgi:hypothetical protein